MFEKQTQTRNINPHDEAAGLIPLTGSGCASVLNTHLSKGNNESSEKMR